MLLPSLIFGSQVECTGVLKVWRQDNSLISGLAGQLNSQIPGIQSDKNKVETLGCDVLVGKRIKSVDGITKASSIPNMLPGKCREGCYEDGKGLAESSNFFFQKV